MHAMMEFMVNFGWGERSRDGERILEFTDSLNMVVKNTFFKMDDEKLITVLLNLEIVQLPSTMQWCRKKL